MLNVAQMTPQFLVLSGVVTGFFEENGFKKRLFKNKQSLSVLKDLIKFYD